MLAEQLELLSLVSVFIFLLQALHLQRCSSAYGIDDTEFATARGTQFVVKGGAFYPNGFNAYWLMHRASEEAEKIKVSVALQQASMLGLNVVRTWAFSDGGYKPLQYSPGSYDEAMFRGLDFVIAEANKYGIRVILSLVNNDEELGGRKQYVEWARELEGQHLTSDDDFYTNHVVKGYYKNYVKSVLTRINTITGIAYKDEPIIFAWELMNEPRCLSDLSGNTLKAWIAEMAAYVKSIDTNHLLEVGLEGFYGESVPGRKQFNPVNNNDGDGSDFISNNLVPGIDFATIHAYPDQWIPESDEETQLSFLRSWITSHIDDAGAILEKPLLIAEFGKSSKLTRRQGCSYSRAIHERDALFATVYDIVYASIEAGGGGSCSCSGALFWQLLLEKGMDELRDGYEIVVSESPSTAAIISQHSRNIQGLTNALVIESSRAIV